VKLRGEPVPSEDPQPEEGGLQEEGEQSLDRQGSAEDVTDEAGVVAPVHPELELLDDAGDQAQREVDREELAEELRQPEHLGVAMAKPGGLEAGDDEREADRHRDEEEVVHGGNCELPSCDVHGAHGAPSVRSVLVVAFDTTRLAGSFLDDCCDMNHVPVRLAAFLRMMFRKDRYDQTSA
jgi:hypothetical protein